MQELKAKWVGIAPIMFHNERLANWSDPITRELKQLTGQRKKTDDIQEQIKKLEWRGGFYDWKGFIGVPADNVLASVLNGAKKLRKGKDVSAGVLCQEAFFELQFDGPKTIEGLWKAGTFCDYRGVVVGGRRIMRARPIIHNWTLTVSLFFDSEIITKAELKQACEIAGERIGLCERRPRCGRFLVEVLN